MASSLARLTLRASSSAPLLRRATPLLSASAFWLRPSPLAPALLRASKASLTTSATGSLRSNTSSLRSARRGFSDATASTTSTPEKHEFQAETRKLLDIVAKSLYTDKEVFLRELISNASDALEKYRGLSMVSGDVVDADVEPEIRIYTDEKANTVTIQDTGIGMTKEELIEYLGTIARSGSQEFMKQATESEKVANIIGQFGVGFYSTFMVGNRVRVETRHAKAGSKSYLWTSDGSGSFEISEIGDVTRGTKITVELKDDAKEFASSSAIESIVKKYSNFVGYTIKLNDEEVNTVKAIWMMPKNKVSEEDHKDFYHFVSKAYDSPTYRLHFNTDTPISVNALFYFPSQHTEKYGLGRMEPGVSLYCRKVLIQSHSKHLLPEWLRFVKGVVDSPDIPLNLSREHLQDSALIRRLSVVLTRRIIKHIQEQLKEDRAKYETWFAEFGHFLKEGLSMDFQWKEDLAKLLLSESSALEAGKLSTLEEYVSRMKEDQKEIYWLCVPNRTIAETSPYYESFKERGLEVLFLYTPLDEFVMSTLGEVLGKKIVSIESASANRAEDNNELLASDAAIPGLRQWLKDVLSEHVSAVKTSLRLVASPAVIVDHESANFRRMMRSIDPANTPKLPKQTLEINPKHPLILNLNQVRESDPELAKSIAEQLFDNALIGAGLLDDPRTMLGRLNTIMVTALERARSTNATSAESNATSSGSS